MGLSYDDGGKGGTHIGALINLKKKRKKSVGKQKLEKDTILHGMGRLGSRRAQLLLAAPKNQDRGCPGSCPISTSLTGGQDALRNLCRLHWLAYLTLPYL